MTERSVVSKNPRESVLELLQQVGTSGTFATSGDCSPEMTMPGLTVDGIGNVALPLSEAAALALLGKCRKTGNKNMDNQMDPSGFSIQNPAWKESIENLARDVCHGKLGVSKDIKVQAILDKLIVLEPGAIYSGAPQGDEKAGTSFGTLIVTLPSIFDGGAMVVNHAGHQKTVLSPSKESPYKSQYTAFYNDCQLSDCHPIKEGHRLCLTYTLAVENELNSVQLPCAASNCCFDIVQKLREKAAAWNAKFDGNKLVIMVDHLKDPTSKFKADLKAIINLLKLAVKEGVGLDWSRGSINHRIYGYGMGPTYDCEWGGTEEIKMTLNVCNPLFDGDDVSDSDEDPDSDNEDNDNNWAFGCYEDLEDEFHADEDYQDGNATLDAAREMVPSTFYDRLKPDERFEQEYHGIYGKRQYDIEKVLVIWPESWTWKVAIHGNLAPPSPRSSEDPPRRKRKQETDMNLANTTSASKKNKTPVTDHDVIVIDD